MNERYYAQEIAYWMTLAGLFLKDDRKEEARKCLMEVQRLANERESRNGKGEEQSPRP